MEIHGNTVEYWRKNAEENYMTTPISVLKYISVLEEQAAQLLKPTNLVCDTCTSFTIKGKMFVCKKCGKEQKQLSVS